MPHSSEGNKLVYIPSLVINKFHEKITPGLTDACWLWPAGSRLGGRGYGAILYRQKKVYLAHRIAYYIANGPFPRHLFVCHRCDVKRCCNPAHLVLGTQSYNMLDSCVKQRNAFGEKHGNTHLTDKDVLNIRRIAARGKISHNQLAKQYKVAQATISRIARGELWVHVEGPTLFRRGTLRGEDQFGAKLTEADVKNIRRRYRAGETVSSIRLSFKRVSESAVSFAARGETWGHLAGAVGPRGPAKGERTGMAKLTSKKVKYIRKVANQGMTYTAIAKKMGMSIQATRAAAQGFLWKHVPGRVHTPPGVNRGSRCHRAKIDEKDVKVIRMRLARGAKQTVLAKEYGVRQGSISAIHLRKTWKHVK